MQVIFGEIFDFRDWEIYVINIRTGDNRNVLFMYLNFQVDAFLKYSLACMKFVICFSIVGFCKKKLAKKLTKAVNLKKSQCFL